jgi:hypothetical protein
VAVGFALVIVGLYAFVVGLKLGLFPIGQRMAEQLIGFDTWLWVYLFAFAIGFATTMAEPALIAVGQQAEEAAAGKIQGNVIRMLVALAWPSASPSASTASSAATPSTTTSSAATSW